MPLDRLTKRTLTTRRALRSKLMRVRAMGYGMDNEEIEEGLRCVGAPLRDYTGRVVAAISIAGPLFRITNERLPELARLVMADELDLSLDLVYREESQNATRTTRRFARAKVRSA